MKMSSLSVSVQDKPLLHDINFFIKPGSVHALMGPNGSGKSSLALTLVGHPDYQVTQGSIMLDGNNIGELSVDKRAKAGLFLVFQQPFAIPGVTVMQFLYEAYRAVRNPHSIVGDFYVELIEAMDLLEIDYAFAQRHVHDGFSGGQKKKLELLQLYLLRPKVAILDELDSGLDVDAFKVVVTALKKIRSLCPEMSLLIITHYEPLLESIVPDYVHILLAGKLVRSGDCSLVHSIKEKGYDAFK